LPHGDVHGAVAGEGVAVPAAPPFAQGHPGAGVATGSVLQWGGILTPLRTSDLAGYAPGCLADSLLSRRGCATVSSGPALPSAECAERRADLFGEELRLFPGGEMAALVGLVVVDEVGVGPLGPAARRLILLAREDARGHRDGDALGVEEATLVFPVQTRRRDPRVRHPVERDVVQDLLPGQLARGAGGPVQRRHDRCGGLAAGIVVVQQPGGQADW